MQGAGPPATGVSMGRLEKDRKARAKLHSVPACTQPAGVPGPDICCGSTARSSLTPVPTKEFLNTSTICLSTRPIPRSTCSVGKGIHLQVAGLSREDISDTANIAMQRVPTFSPRSWEVAAYYYQFVQKLDLTPRQGAGRPPSSTEKRKNLMGVLTAAPGKDSQRKIRCVLLL